jgi:DNA topoisomerase-1
VTEEALLRAVSNPGKINMNLVRAQWARQVLDMLIGFNVSPVLWKYMYYDKENSLSAGRCQTPALRLVYDNEQERIRGKGLEKTYKILGDFTGRHLDFVLSREFTEPQEVLDFMEQSRAFTHVLSLGSPKTPTYLHRSLLIHRVYYRPPAMFSIYHPRTP